MRPDRYHFPGLEALVQHLSDRRAGEKVGTREDGECPPGTYCTFDHEGSCWRVENRTTVGRLRALLRAYHAGNAVVVDQGLRTRLKINPSSDRAPDLRGLYIWRCGRALPPMGLDPLVAS